MREEGYSREKAVIIIASCKGGGGLSKRPRKEILLLATALHNSGPDRTTFRRSQEAFLGTLIISLQPAAVPD